MKHQFKDGNSASLQNENYQGPPAFLFEIEDYNLSEMIYGGLDGIKAIIPRSQNTDDHEINSKLNSNL
jgi:hypothetical protein